MVGIELAWRDIRREQIMARDWALADFSFLINATALISELT